MSTSMTSVKLPPFKGNPKLFWLWKPKFEAVAAKRGYSHELHTAYDAAKLSEVENNAKSIGDLMLCMEKDADAQIVVSTKTYTHKEGQLKEAFDKLKIKYQPGTEEEKEELMQELYDLSRICISTNRETKLEELIRIQQDLKEYHNETIDDKVVVTQLLNSLPPEYETLVEIFKTKTTSPTYDELRAKIKQKYRSIKKQFQEKQM